MPRTLLQKLGIKAGFKVYFIDAPDNYITLLEDPLPEEVVVCNALDHQPFDFIHLFTNKVSALEAHLPVLQDAIVQNGMIWVSWYKKASKLQTELNEDIIRDTALSLKLVDVKVCSVSPEWSALKLVIRKSLRTSE